MAMTDTVIGGEILAVDKNGTLETGLATEATGGKTGMANRKAIEPKKTDGLGTSRPDVRNVPEYMDWTNIPHDAETRVGFAESERELLGEVARAVRSIKYGSILLTIHDGRLVEITKTTRMRKNPVGRKE